MLLDTHNVFNNVEALDGLRVVELVRGRADRGKGHLALVVPLDELGISWRPWPVAAEIGEETGRGTAT